MGSVFGLGCWYTMFRIHTDHARGAWRIFGPQLLMPGLLEPRTMGDTFSKDHTQHQILVAEQESKERTLSSPVQPAPTNLHSGGGSRPEIGARFCLRALLGTNSGGRRCCRVEETESGPFIPPKPEMWNTILKPGFGVKFLVLFCPWWGSMSEKPKGQNSLWGLN